MSGKQFNEQVIKIDTQTLQMIAAAVDELRFGSVEITVHDGRVTQIEKREKLRFHTPPTEKFKSAN